MTTLLRRQGHTSKWRLGQGNERHIQACRYICQILVGNLSQVSTVIRGCVYSLWELEPCGQTQYSARPHVSTMLRRSTICRSAARQCRPLARAFSQPVPRPEPPRSWDNPLLVKASATILPVPVPEPTRLHNQKSYAKQTLRREARLGARAAKQHEGGIAPGRRQLRCDVGQLGRRTEWSGQKLPRSESLGASDSEQNPYSLKLDPTPRTSVVINP